MDKNYNDIHLIGRNDTDIYTIREVKIIGIINMENCFTIHCKQDNKDRTIIFPKLSGTYIVID